MDDLDIATHAVPDGIRLSRTGCVLTVTLDRPDRRNAITADMWRWFGEQLHAVAADARLVVLQGANGVFSAGADIAEFEVVRRDATTALAYERLNSDAFKAVRTLACPTLAVIPGACFGGGLGLAAACDLRIATSTARFCVPAAKLGLAYPADAIGDIVGAFSPQMAGYLVYSGAAIDVAEAKDAGFLLNVVDEAALPMLVAKTTRAIADAAPLSNRATKAAIHAHRTGLAADLEEAERLGAATFDSADYREGRAAFREKRTPRFDGR